MMEKGMINNDNGVVLVMVLLLLVATILLGIAVSRSAFFESKIAGNQRIYQNDFYTTEGASDYVVSEFDNIMSELSAPALNTPVSLASLLPTTSPIHDVSSATITLVRSANPPIGSGTSAANAYANYYVIETTRNNQTVKVGVWKAFPKVD